MTAILSVKLSARQFLQMGSDPPGADWSFSTEKLL